MDDATDLKVMLAATVIVLMAIVMVALRIAERLQGGAQYAELFFWSDIAAGIVIFIAAITGGPLAIRVMRERRLATADALASRKQVEQLFQMTDMLQSAMDHPDANAVLRSTAEQLLTGFGGALYVFNNSRDRLDLSTTWNWPQDQPPPETVSPSHCWALKRGKTHANLLGLGALRCDHHGSEIAVLEIPMMARGEVYGLLNLQTNGHDAAQRLAGITQLAAALADAMSLALSNIALREKLRTQALRDPLTGLYNRRYMEDVLGRYVSLAERNGSPVAAIMIDLDHFKQLNDEHGHAMGDAILREVAMVLAGSIRQCDVACRYGGEELVVLLPDCSLDYAVSKAELLRGRIEALSDSHGARVTASFGVAALPETTAHVGELLTMADAALYRAKHAGRNRVLSAPRRAVVIDEGLQSAQMLPAKGCAYSKSDLDQTMKNNTISGSLSGELEQSSISARASSTSKDLNAAVR